MAASSSVSCRLSLDFGLGLDLGLAGTTDFDVAAAGAAFEPPRAAVCLAVLLTLALLVAEVVAEEDSLGPVAFLEATCRFVVADATDVEELALGSAIELALLALVVAAVVPSLFGFVLLGASSTTIGVTSLRSATSDEVV